MSKFLQMKKNRENAQKKLVESINTSNGRVKDERIYYPKRDEGGNASVIIRFLPAPDPDAIPFVKKFSHGFQHPVTKRWFIEACPSTIDLPSPANEYTRAEWDKGREFGEKVRYMSRKTKFYSNILVVKDSKNPELEGKVMIFEYGKKIFDKITAAAKPKFEEDKPINVFDMWEGANFNLRITRDSDNNTTYNDSRFLEPSSIGDDAYCEKVFEQLHDIYDLIAPNKFKSYEDLQKSFWRALGLSGNAGTPAPAPAPAEEAVPKQSSEAPNRPTESASAPQSSSASVGEEEEVDPLAFFSSLAKDD